MEYAPLVNEPFLWKAPGDRACLLLHGLGGGVYAMQWLGEVLHRQGWTVMGINYPGHDRPSTKMPSSTWDEWFDHIEQSYLSLAKEYNTITVIGFSTGCPLGIHLANRQPVSRLVLLCPYLDIRYRWYYGFRLERYIQSIGQLIETVPRLRLPIADSDMEKLASEVAFFKTFNLSAVRSAIAGIETHVKPHLAKISIPTFIIQAERDSVVDPAGAERIYQTIQSQEKELVWLPKSDHVVTLDLEREQVYERVRSWLR